MSFENEKQKKHYLNYQAAIKSYQLRQKKLKD